MKKIFSLALIILCAVNISSVLAASTNSDNTATATLAATRSDAKPHTVAATPATISTLATTEVNSLTTPVQIAQSATTTKSITVYSEPANNAKVIEQVTQSNKLVPIYANGTWLKVGDSTNGQIGWVNSQQYQQLQTAQNNASTTQVVFVESNHSTGAPNSNIIAYKNGQRLSDAEAKALYAQMTQQQMAMNKQLAAYQAAMNHLLQQDMQAFNNTFATMSNMPVIQPVIVVNNNQK